MSIFYWPWAAVPQGTVADMLQNYSWGQCPCLPAQGQHSPRALYHLHRQLLHVISHVADFNMNVPQGSDIKLLEM